MIDVLDLVRLEPGALERGADRDRPELRRGHVREAAAEPPERRPDGRDDHRACHGFQPTHAPSRPVIGASVGATAATAGAPVLEAGAPPQRDRHVRPRFRLRARPCGRRSRTALGCARWLPLAPWAGGGATGEAGACADDEHTTLFRLEASDGGLFRLGRRMTGIATITTDLLTPLGAYLRLRGMGTRQLPAGVGRARPARACLVDGRRVAARDVRGGGGAAGCRWSGTSRTTTSRRSSRRSSFRRTATASRTAAWSSRRPSSASTTGPGRPRCSRAIRTRSRAGSRPASPGTARRAAPPGRSGASPSASATRRWCGPSSATSSPATSSSACRRSVQSGPPRPPRSTCTGRCDA